MNKKIISLLVLLALTALLAVGVLAAEEPKTVYLGTGRDAETMAEALSLLNKKGGTIVLCQEFTLSKVLTIPEQENDLTITAEDGGSLKFTATTLKLENNTNANVVTFDLPIKTATAGLNIFGGFNSITFGKNFVVDGIVNFYGGVDAPVGTTNYTTELTDADADANRACITELPYSITVKNGTFGVFTGGNRRTDSKSLYGSIAARLDVTIEGGTFGTPVTYGVNDALKIDAAISLSGQSILADDATLTIKGGTFNAPIYVNAHVAANITTASVCSFVTGSDKKYYATDGNIVIDIQGGTFTENCFEISAEQTAASFNRLLRGNFTLNIGADAVLADGTVLDATQVKAYNGVTDKAATLNYNNTAAVTPKRFDVVNGTTQAELAEPTRIACVGDSITQGTGSVTFSTKSYPAQLYTKAVAEKKDVIISNFGCGATKVLDYSGLYYRAGFAYTMSTEETDADWVLIGLGTNDAGTVANTEGQKSHFSSAYADLIEQYTENPETEMVYCTSAIYRYTYGVEAVAVRYLQSKTIADMNAAGNDKVTYVDLYSLTLDRALDGTLHGSDELHPDAEGYTHYADKIYGALYEGKTADPKYAKKSDIYVDQSVKATNPTGDGSKENPFWNLSVAFAVAAPESTIHIVGAYKDYNYASRENGVWVTNGSWSGFNTPLDVEKLTIVGEADASGNPGKLVMSSKMLYFNSDVTLDNLDLSYYNASSPALYTFFQYNNVTFTETLTTSATGNMILFAGYCVHDDNIAEARYTPAELVSSDQDCTINLLGGKALYFYGGNFHYNASNAMYAPYGTYSGNMTINIGKGFTFRAKDSNDYNSALCGMNYMTGTITANIDSWNSGQPIREFSKLTNQSVRVKEYNELKNTGKFIINSTVDNEVLVTGDMNKDGKVDFADTMLLLKYVAQGVDATYNPKSFYQRESVSLLHVLRAITSLAK